MRKIIKELTVSRESLPPNAYIGDEFAVNLGMTYSAGRAFRVGDPRRFNDGRMMRVLEGAIVYSINLQTFSLGKDDVIVVPPGVVVELVSISDNICLQALSYKGDTTDRVLVASLTGDDVSEYGQGVLAIWRALHLDPQDVDCARYLYLSILARIKYLSSRQETLSPSGRSGDIFRRFLALVNEKASGSMRIPLYADALNITPHYLSSLVKNVSGKSVMDYNRQAVIQRAKILLRQGFTATQAADDLDFPNLPYFNRFFKRHTGLTPGEYKQQKP